MIAGASPDVLVVDDDLDLRETIVEALTVVGYRVEEASNGAAALEMLKTRRPHLVLLDLMMPGMDGWQFRYLQQQDVKLADIPVVLLSAAVDLESQAVAMQPSGILPKPLDLRRLREVVAQHCDH